jgi:hypothetical protein
VIRLTIIFSLLIALSACDETQSEAMGVPDRVTRVTVTSPQQRQINYVLTALGSVESIHDPTISAETSGQIVSIDTAEGDAVVARKSGKGDASIFDRASVVRVLSIRLAALSAFRSHLRTGCYQSVDCAVTPILSI